MITISFDLAAFVAGLFLGIIFGMLMFLLIETRDGGAWGKGFDDGSNFKYTVEKFENIVKKMEGKNESN